MKKHFFALALCALLGALALFPATALANDGGTCDDGMTWEYNSTTHALTISGEGEMGNYKQTHDEGCHNYFTTAPWGAYAGEITSITLASTITSVGEYAFYGMRVLPSLSLPEGLTRLGEKSFAACDLLRMVHLPASLSYMDRHAFYDDWQIERVDVANLNAYLSCFVYGNEASPMSYGAELTVNGTPVENVVVPSGLAYVPPFAFAGCTTLKSITFPAEMTSIPEGAFEDCTGLTVVELPADLRSIGDFAFARCKNLEVIIAPASLERVEYGAFNGSTALSDVYYAGTPETRANISVAGGSAPFQNAYWHYGEIYVPTIKGDVNNNGTMNIVDVQIAYDISTGSYAGDEYADMRRRADVNKDGTPDATDAFAIQHAIHYGWGSR